MEALFTTGTFGPCPRRDQQSAAFCSELLPGPTKFKMSDGIAATNSCQALFLLYDVVVEADICEGLGASACPVSFNGHVSRSTPFLA